jgi:hypothetical protein
MRVEAGRRIAVGMAHATGLGHWLRRSATIVIYFNADSFRPPKTRRDAGTGRSAIDVHGARAAKPDDMKKLSRI